MSDTMRISVTLPRELVEQLDREVGQRGRGAFIADVLAEKLRRQSLLAVAEAALGSLADVDVPGWETTESTRAWVRAQRRGECPCDAVTANGA